jgi:hypothetical protein
MPIMAEVEQKQKPQGHSHQAQNKPSKPPGFCHFVLAIRLI